jgi:hypothetical protein
MSPLLSRRAAFLPILLFSFLASGLPLSTARAHAQEEVVPFLRGEVRIGEAPLTEGFVVLHQVSAESSGEVDSVRVGPDGSFQIRLPHVPDHTSRPEIFFVSVRYRDLLYFGEAVTEAAQLDTLYLIQAYDTLSVPPGGAEIPLSARNLFLEKAEVGWIATDLFNLRQEGDRTLYSPEERVVWAYPLPESATDFQVGQADMAPDAIRFANGRLEVYSPLPPGERYLMVRYSIPENNFVLPLPGTTDRMEILVREPAPSVEFQPLALSSPVELDPGNVFRRYAADNLRDMEVVATLASEPWSLPAEWLGLAVAALLGAAGIFGYRRRGMGLRLDGGPTEGSSREQLLLSIAKLDEDFEGGEDRSARARAEYGAERKRLLSRLKRLP